MDPESVAHSAVRRYSVKKCELILSTGCCGLFGVAVIPIMQRYLSFVKQLEIHLFIFVL
jgi:hypothetical protein